MFIVPEGVRCMTWSHTTHGRGKRNDDVQIGCYVVEHIPTGKFIVGSSKTVSQEVDGLIEALWGGTHQSKAFNKLCSLDPDLKLYEYPTKTLKHAKDIEKAIRRTVLPVYLLLN